MAKERIEQLDVEECLALLEGRHFGRIAVNDEKGPLIFPVNYLMDQGSVVFRTDLGTKLQAAVQHAKATFQVDAIDGQQLTGWSVMIRGKVEEVTDPAELERLRKLPLQPFAGGHKEHYVRVMSASITGRRIPVPAQVPEGWFKG